MHAGLVEKIDFPRLHHVLVAIHKEFNIGIRYDWQMKAKFVVLLPPGNSNNALSMQSKVTTARDRLHAKILKLRILEISAIELRDVFQSRVECPVFKPVMIFVEKGHVVV